MAYDAARTVIVFIDPIQQAVSTASHHSLDVGSGVGRYARPDSPDKWGLCCRRGSKGW
jgi:hypothetical protein